MVLSKLTKNLKTTKNANIFENFKNIEIGENAKIL